MNVEYRISNIECRISNVEGRRRRYRIPHLHFYILHFTVLHFTFYLSSCSPTPPAPIPAFYHWQTALEISLPEAAFLSNLKTQKLYVKFFDVAWEESLNEPVPVAEVQIQQDGLENFEIIPTVFITNQTLRQLPTEGISLLAQRICDKLFELMEQLPSPSVSEIQIDCDWSGQTREAYFELLESIKNLIQVRNIRLSATIRLHQVKFMDQTGVPPVDRGMLMFYNVGTLEDWQEENSILTLQTARAYTAKLDRYPLDLDLALPIFAWGVLFRQGRMIKLINNLRPSELSDSSRFYKKEDNRFEVIKSTYLDGYYLYRGDLIRTEAISMDLLHQAIALLKTELPSTARTLAFYHLDTSTIKHFSHEDLEALFEEVVQK